jgi:hypothetical protein
VSKHTVKAGRLLLRGGARNWANRSSHQLTERQCRDLINASLQADAQGQPFNRFITLLWERGGIDGRANAKVTGRFIKLASDWARRHGYRLVWAWVQEWGRVNGAHIHMLLHLPNHLDWQFCLMPRRWAKQCLGGRYVSGVVNSKRVKADRWGLSYQDALMRRVHYMLKYAPAELEGKLDMTAKGLESWGKSGIVTGKRLARWQDRVVPPKRDKIGKVAY